MKIIITKKIATKIVAQMETLVEQGFAKGSMEFGYESNGIPSFGVGVYINGKTGWDCHVELSGVIPGQVARILGIEWETPAYAGDTFFELDAAQRIAKEIALALEACRNAGLPFELMQHGGEK